MHCPCPAVAHIQNQSGISTARNYALSETTIKNMHRKRRKCAPQRWAQAKRKQHRPLQNSCDMFERKAR
eukprot:15474409-Alexandrium_andersonii.AAC.1